MTMVSRRYLAPDIEGRIKEVLFLSIARMNRQQSVKEFFSEFFTPTEQTMFAKRLAIAVLLVKGYEFRSINKILKVSNNTIERANYWIRHAGRHMKKLVEEIIVKEKSEETSHNFWYAVESASVTLQHGSWKERRAQIEKEHREFKRKHIV